MTFRSSRLKEKSAVVANLKFSLLFGLYHPVVDRGSRVRDRILAVDEEGRPAAASFRSFRTP